MQLTHICPEPNTETRSHIIHSTQLAENTTQGNRPTQPHHPPPPTYTHTHTRTHTHTHSHTHKHIHTHTPCGHTHIQNTHILENTSTLTHCATLSHTHTHTHTH